MRMIPLKLAGLVLVAVAGFATIACDDAPAAEGEGEGEGEGEDKNCTIDRDCGTGSICDKTNDGDSIPAADDPEGVCLRITCNADTQCAEDEFCDLRRGVCFYKNSCDPGDASTCTNAGDVCQFISGRPSCAPAPAATNCILTPATAFVAAGGKLDFEGVGTNAAGKLVAHSTFGFAAASGTFTGATFTAPATGPVTVTGTTANGGATCIATVNVYPAVAATDLRVVLIDQGSRTPLAGTKVAARVAGVNVEGTTAADGSFTFTAGAEATSVSVFPAGHQWHTLIDPPNDVILYTAKVQAQPVVDGVTGTFDFADVTTQGDIKLGLAGAAINAAITDLDFKTIIGEFVDTQIDIEGITADGGQTVGLPEGLVIGLGATDFKGNYVALSDKKGPGIAWALAGRVQLSKIGTIISSVTGGDDLDFGKILGAVLPFFATFDPAVVTGLDFDPAVRNGTTGFENVTIKPNTLMSQSALYDMPNLPCAPGAFGATTCTEDIFLLTTGPTDAKIKTVLAACPATLPAGATCEKIAPYTSGAVVITGVVVPGQGLVPLGLSAGLDTLTPTATADGIPEQAGQAAGKLLMDYAPPHDGLEGNLYVTVAIALDINQLSGTADLGASIITQVSRRLSATGNNFNGNSFLQSQGGTFVAGATGSFALAKKGAADFYRVNFDDNAAQEWNVWFAGSNDGDFAIGDLAQHSEVNVGARTAHADVQAFKLGAGYDGVQPASFDELFAFNGRDIDNLLYYLGGWSSESCKADGICAVSGP